MIEDKLDAIFRMQKYFADQLEKTDKFPGLMSTEHKIDKLCQAIIHEAVELQDLTQWKWWKTYKGFNEAEAREELIDILHFVIHAALVLGMTPQDFLNAYTHKMEINKQRQERGY